MLEIKKQSEQTGFNLYFDNKLISDASVWKESNSKDKFNVSLPFNEQCKNILTEPKNLSGINKLRIYNILDWIDLNYFGSLVDIFVNEREGILTLDLCFLIEGKLFDWDLPFSLNLYAEKYVSIWEWEFSYYGDIETLAEPYDLYLTITFPFENDFKSIIKEITAAKEIIETCHQKTLESLQSETKKLYFATLNFPESLKVPCQQYLIYFVSFLKDLGINATSDLREEAGKVLFSVTPTDDVEAFDKIREALAVYLNLPNSPITDIEYSENFALMRLQQQVRNLHHSQQMAKTELLSTQYALKLAQQNIDNQDQLLTRQNSTIENQNKIIEKIMSKSIMMDSLENKEELEEICEGLKIGKSKFLKEQLGIELNPATFLKGVGKKILGKPENTSIIETDEEK